MAKLDKSKFTPPKFRPQITNSGAWSRDMEESPFHAMLLELISRVPGAFAAALVDEVGETVDYAGAIDPDDIKIASAHWRVVLAGASVTGIGDARSISVSGTLRSFVVAALGNEYAVIALLSPGRAVAPLSRAFAVFEQALIREVGLELRPVTDRWFHVSVACDDERRPFRVIDDGIEESIDVLGAIRGLGTNEMGFRVRSKAGGELTLVRERTGIWYADTRLGVPGEGSTEKP